MRCAFPPYAVTPFEKSGLDASIPWAGVSDGENLDIASASPIRDDIIPDNKPARARQWAGRAGIGKLGELLLCALEGFKKTLSRWSAVLLEVSRNFLYLRRCVAGAEDTDCHLLRWRFFSVLLMISRTSRIDSASGALSPRSSSARLSTSSAISAPSSSRYWRSARNITQERGRSSIAASLSNA